VLGVDVIALSTKHLLRLVERPVGCSHYLIKGDIPWVYEKEVPTDDLRPLQDVITINHRGRGCTHLGSQG
jgi:hypothetical protein